MSKHLHAGLGQIGVMSCLLLALSACTSRIDSVPPSLETLRILREGNVPSLSMGKFTSASKDVGKAVTIRLSTLRPPSGGNYANFLASTFESELRTAGKLDPASQTQIEAVLTESHVGEDMAKGDTSLGATISLRRSGETIFTKPYRVEAHWKSDFIGALAIPEAFRQYNALYATLVRQVFSDPEFIAAAR